MHAFTTFASDFDRLALDVAWKTTVVFACAWVVAGILSLARSSAAARHLVWVLALASSLLLPMLSAFPTGWQIDWPGTAFLPQPESTFVASEDSQAGLPSMPAVELASAPLDLLPDEAIAGEAASLTSGLEVTSSTSQTADGVLNWQIGQWLRGLWMVGFVVALVPVALAFASLWLLTQRSRPITAGHGW